MPKRSIISVANELNVVFLYNSSDGTFLNADANGTYNILRKAQDFSFGFLCETVGSKIKQWLHPVKRIRFLNKKTH